MTTTSRAVLPTEPGPTSAGSGTRVSAGALVLATMLGLASCGGGGSSSPSPAPGPAPIPGPAPAPAPAPSGAPLATSSCDAFPSAATVQAGSLAGNASSPSGRSLTFSLVSQAKSGTVQLSSTGAFTYTRTSAARGDSDSFVYKVTDSAGLSAEGTARVIYGTRRIMPLGDSITDGVVSFNNTTGDLPAVPSRVGYRKFLRDRLAASGYAVDFVGSQRSGSAAGLADDDHEGHPGFRQADLVPTVVSYLNQSPADVVLLHIGTNDVPGNTSASSTAAPSSSILGNVNSWTATNTNPPVQLLLAKIIGQRSNTPEVGQFNANLQNLYDSNWADPSGSRPRFVVDLVDMNSKLNTTTDLSSATDDTPGLHPSPTGYEKMANAWFDFLVQNQAVTKCP